jgi:hypothetical protein
MRKNPIVFMFSLFCVLFLGSCAKNITLLVPSRVEAIALSNEKATVSPELENKALKEEKILMGYISHLILKTGSGGTKSLQADENFEFDCCLKNGVKVPIENCVTCFQQGGSCISCNNDIETPTGFLECKEEDKTECLKHLENRIKKPGTNCMPPANCTSERTLILASLKDPFSDPRIDNFIKIGGIKINGNPVPYNVYVVKMNSLKSGTIKLETQSGNFNMPVTRGKVPINQISKMR